MFDIVFVLLFLRVFSFVHYNSIIIYECCKINGNIGIIMNSSSTCDLTPAAFSFDGAVWVAFRPVNVYGIRNYGV
jgi:hypothetical protein